MEIQPSSVTHKALVKIEKAHYNHMAALMAEIDPAIKEI